MYVPMAGLTMFRSDERSAIEALGRCNFAPATWDKKFAHHLAGTPQDYQLSPKQREWLWKLVKRYKRQIPRHLVVLADYWLTAGEDERAFLAAIAANPDDDAPRLVYADWLDEHDKGAIAAFVRKQVAERAAAEKSKRRNLSHGQGEARQEAKDKS